MWACTCNPRKRRNGRDSSAPSRKLRSRRHHQVGRYSCYVGSSRYIEKRCDSESSADSQCDGQINGPPDYKIRGAPRLVEGELSLSFRRSSPSPPPAPPRASPSSATPSRPASPLSSVRSRWGSEPQQGRSPAGCRRRRRARAPRSAWRARPSAPSPSLRRSRRCDCPPREGASLACVAPCLHSTDWPPPPLSRRRTCTAASRGTPPPPRTPPAAG
mmetsp:Transcript_274/g.767  ORF Transcript_274/g.767 Transcript_274/m.767 type:complete len:216 (-) Transcript_274:515-1162(-)